MDYYEEKIEKSLNKNLLKNHETKNKVGYLKIDGLRPYVYQMVADAWLKGYTYNPYNIKYIYHLIVIIYVSFRRVIIVTQYRALCCCYYCRENRYGR